MCFLLPLGNTRGTRRYACRTYLQEHVDLRKPSARDHISVLLSQIPRFQPAEMYPTHPMRYGPFRKERVGEVESSRNRIRQVGAERRRASS